MSVGAVTWAATAPARTTPARKKKVTVPRSVRPPVLSGAGAVGATLTMTRGAWRGAVTTWQTRFEQSGDGREWRPARGASGMALRLKPEHAGVFLRGCVRAGRGTLMAPWRCTAKAVMPTPYALRTPQVNGDAKVGVALAGEPGRWVGARGQVSRQWQSSSSPSTGFSDIRGATGPMYTPQARDEGRYVRVVVTARNPGGPARATSKAVGPIAVAADRTAPTAPVVTGGSLAWRDAPEVIIRGAGSTDARGEVSYQTRVSLTRGASWSVASAGDVVTVTSEGETWVQVRARDAAGNVSAWAPAHASGAPEAAGVARLDRTAPARAPALSGGSLEWRTQPVTISASGGADNVAVAGYDYRTSRDDGLTWSAPTAGEAVTVTDEDQTLVQFRARDAAGHVGSWTPSHLSAPAVPDVAGVARVNRLAPLLTLTQAPDQPDPASSATVRFVLASDEPLDASSVTASDFTVSGGSGPSVACALRSCALTVSASGGGAVLIAPSAFFAVADRGGGVQTVAGGADRAVYYDTVPPQLTLDQASGQADPTRVSPVQFALTSTEPLATGSVGAADFTVTGGTVSSLSCPDAQLCVIGVDPGATQTTVQIAPSAGFGVTDQSGNLQTGVAGSDRAVVYDVRPPTLGLAQAGGQADPTGAPVVEFALSADEPLDASTVAPGDFAVTGGSAPTVSCASATMCTLRVTATGAGTVRIAPSATFAVADAIGNVQGAVGGTDRTITYDNTPPALSLTQAPDQADPTADAAVRFVLAADELIDGTSVSAADFSVTGGTGPDVDCAGTACTLTVQATGSGTVTIAPAGAFAVADAVGNVQTGSPAGSDRTVTVDVTPPTLSLAQAATQADPTTEEIIAFTLTADEPLETSGVSAADFVASDADVVAASCASSQSCTVSVMATRDNASVEIAPAAAFAVSDVLGNEATTITGGSDRTVMFTPPTTTLTLTQAADQADPTNDPALRFRLAADVGLQQASVTTSDFAPVRGSIQTIACDAAGCDVMVAATGEGAVILQTSASFAVTDVNGDVRTRVASGDRTVVYDTTPPVVSLAQAATQADPTTVRTMEFTLGADTPLDPTSVSAADLAVTNGSLQAIDCSAATRCTLTVRAGVAGAVTVAPSPSFAVADLAGNAQTTASGADRQVTYAPTALEVDLTRAPDQPTPTAETTVRFQLTGNRSLDPDTVSWLDFDVSNGSFAGVSCAAETCTVRVSVGGAGAVAIAPAAGFAVADLQGGSAAVAGGADDRTVEYAASAVGPLVLGRAAGQDATSASPALRFALTSTEPIDVTTFTAADLQVAGGSLGAITCGDFSLCTISVTASGPGSVTISPSADFAVSAGSGLTYRTVGGADRSVTYMPTP